MGNFFTLFFVTILLISFSSCGPKINFAGNLTVAALTQGGSSEEELKESTLQNSSRYQSSTSFSPVWEATNSINTQYFAVKACTDSGCKVNCTLQIKDAESGNVTITDLVDGSSYYICVKEVFRNGEDSGWVASNYAVAIDATPPTVANSPIVIPADQIYSFSSTLDFVVTISEQVFVTGTPRLVLDVNGTTKYADFLSIASGRDLTFRYSVESGLIDSNGITLDSTLDLNGGKIRDNASNDLSSLSLNVTSTAGILIDSTMPEIVSLTLPSNKTYLEAEHLDFVLLTDETIDVVGSPRLVLNIGGVTKYATTTDTSTNSLTFRYTVETGLQDSDGIGLSTTIDLNNGTMKDGAGNSLSSLVFTSGSTLLIKVDSAPPYASSALVLASNGYYNQSDDIDFWLPMSEAVNVSTDGGTPTIQLNVGGLTKYASYVDSSGSSLRFRYQVEAGVNDSNGIGVGSAVVLNGGTIRDAILNNMDPLTFSVGDPSGIIVDTTAPFSTGDVNIPASTTYLAGQNIDLFVPTSETVSVNTAGGTPTIQLNVGGVAKQASYLDNSLGNSLRFRYTLETGLIDANGIEASSDIVLNSGTIKDLAGNNLTPLTFSLPSLAGVLVDSTAPASFGSATIPANGWYAEDATLDFIVTISEDVTVDTAGGTPTISLNIGGTTKNAVYVDANGAGGNSGSSLRFRYIVEAGLYDSDGISVTGIIVLNGATIRDSSLYDLNPVTFTVGGTGGIWVDSIIPAFTGTATIPGSAWYLEDSTLDITLAVTENVTVDTAGGTPYLQLNIGGTSKNASYVDANGAGGNFGNALRFRYVIEAGLYDDNGIVASSSVVLNNGTIRDGGLNDLSPLSFTIGSTAGILVDASVPVATGTTSIPGAMWYTQDQTLDFSITTSSPVVVNTIGGTPTIGITVGSTVKNATYVDADGAGGDTGSTLRFRYVVENGLYDSNGIDVTSDIVLNSGTIRDVAGNDFSPLSFTIGSTAGILVDASVPAATGSATIPLSTWYNRDETMDFLIATTEAVTVSTVGGTPTIALNIGGTTKNASYVDANGAGGNSGSSLRFRYVVESGLVDTNGISVTNSIVLNNGTIRDPAGNNFSPLSFTMGSSAGVLVDSVIPVTSGDITLPTDQYYGRNANLDFILPISETVTVATGGGTPRLQLTIGATTKYATYQNMTGDSLLFRYVIESGLEDTDGIGLSTTLSLNGGLIYDQGSNDLSPLTFSTQSLANIKVDSTSPTNPSNVTPTSSTDQTDSSYSPSWTNGADTNLSYHELKACENSDCSTDCLATISPAVSASDDVTGLAFLNSYYMCVRAVDSLANSSSWVSSSSLNIVTGITTYLNYIGIIQDDVGGVDGLYGTYSVAVSPDGRHIYAIGSSEHKLAVFSRDASSGSPTFVEVQTNLVSGVTGIQTPYHATVSPDGKNVYVAGGESHSIATFARDTSSGALTFIDAQVDDVSGVDGLNWVSSTVISPDGRHLYAPAPIEEKLAHFTRDASSGSLTYVTAYLDTSVDTLSYVYSTAISPDGRNLYVASHDDNCVGVFTRDASSGALTYLEKKAHGVGGVTGMIGAFAVEVSPDGRNVYVVSQMSTDTLVTFARNPNTGALTYLGVDADGVGGVDGLAYPVSVVVSKDGSKVIASAANDDAISLFSRDTTGGDVSYMEVHKDGVYGVDGLDSASRLALSPDGRHLYAPAAAEDKISYFSFPAKSGTLTYSEMKQDGAGGVDGLLQNYAIAISPDGKNVYASGRGENKLAVFSRNSTGDLTYLEVHEDGVSGVDGLWNGAGVTVSPDGRHVYVSAADDMAISIFARDASSGTLTYSNLVKSNVGGVPSFGSAYTSDLSRDGRHLYLVTASYAGLLTFSRDASSGDLTFVQRKQDASDDVTDGLSTGYDVVTSPDGKNVYVCSYGDSAVTVFSRNALTGELAFMEMKKNGVGGVDGTAFCQSVAISPDGRSVYALGSSTLAVFSRDLKTGALTYVTKLTDGVGGVDGLNLGIGLAVSLDGRNVYASSFTDDGVAVFSRNVNSGNLTFVEVHKDGVSGVNGLDGGYDIIVSPDGKSVYSAGYMDNALVHFIRN